MTIPEEELNALKNTREFLREILKMNLTDIRKNPREVRERAIRCLRHFPWDPVIEKMWEARINVWEEEMLENG